MIIHPTKSCLLALSSKSNCATESTDFATNHAAFEATNDLLTLSARVLAKNSPNQPGNIHATNKLHGESHMATIEYDTKRSELKKLIIEVGEYFQATSSEIDEMFEHTLLTHPIDVALMTFRNLLAQCNSSKHLKTAENLQRKAYD